MSKFKNIKAHLLMLLGLVCILPGNLPADEVLWKSGPNLYIKLTKQDKYSDGRIIPNQHPVSLDPRQIRDALNTLLVWNKSFFTGALKDGEEAESVFSLEQSRLLGTHISVGLQKATPNQDIVFAVTRLKKSFLFVKDTTYTAGRAFYANGKLNIIIGDYDRIGDKFKERTHQSAGGVEVKYYFAPGKRAKHSDFDKAIILSDGVKTFDDMGKNRTDWFVIDVELASAEYAAKQGGEDSQQNAVNEERLRQESEKSARERREMRLEMARLRKEMKSQDAGGQSIEERLQKLEQLKENNIITEDEYTTKRAEILDDI